MTVLATAHVLIVEERADYRAKLRKMLGRVGCARIDEACDGPEALVALQKDNEGVDLVVCNLDLGGMDGLEFIRLASRFGVGGLILYSKQDDAVRSSAEWMARAYKAPLLGILGVPFDRGALKRLVDRLDTHRTVYSDVIGEATSMDSPDRGAIEELEAALDAQQFVPYFQPKVCLTTGELRGAEVLARWEHPELGMVGPGHFVGLMEGCGMIERLTHALLDRALRHAGRWSADGLDVELAINVSPLTLEHPDCAKDLLATIAAAGGHPARITFEVTERAFAQDMTTVLENVLRLRMRGCGIAVDDFGTGYSSLQQLNRWPITELKLDRSFVRRIKSNAKAASIIESTLDLAARLKLKTVAEGVEDDLQTAVLMRLGCQLGQGFLYAKPMDAEAFRQWCLERSPIAA